MTKKIISSLMCFLITLSVFAAAINIQVAIAQTPPSHEIPQMFDLEGGAILEIYGATVQLTVYDRITYNYPPLPPPSDDNPIPSIVGQSLTAVSVAEVTDGVEPAWDIRVRGGDFDFAVVGLPGVGLTELWQIDLLRGDINADGEVDCKDLYLIRRALWSSRCSRNRRLRAKWNPSCDLNRDGRVTWRDMRIAFKNYGKTAQWEPLDNVHYENGMIFGETDHFSIFRGR